MDWVSLATLALYISAITISVTNARDHDWGRRKMAGVAIFLLGAGVALFVEDVAAAAGSPSVASSAWVEIVAVAGILVGIGLAMSSRARETPSE